MALAPTPRILTLVATMLRKHGQVNGNNELKLKEHKIL